MSTTSPYQRCRRWIAAAGSAAGRPEFRVLKAVLGAALVVAVALTSKGLFAQLEHLRRPDPSWLCAAIALEASSLLAYASMARELLGLGGITAPIRALLRPTLAGIAMGASLPAGVGASNVYWYRKLRQQNADRGLATLVLSGTSVAGALALCALLLVGAGIAGNAGPAARVHTWLLCLGALLLALRLGFAHRLGRLLTRVLLRIAPTVEPRRAVRARRLRTIMAFAYANWLFDCAALFVSLQAVHAAIPARSVILVYSLAQLVANLALLPGGGETVELSLIASLSAFGHHTGAVLAGVMLYRLLSCWGLIPIGWLAVMLDPDRGRESDRVPLRTRLSCLTRNRRHLGIASG